VFPCAGICTCPANDRGAMCKHLAFVLVTYGIVCHALPCTSADPSNRMLASWLAGDPILEQGWYTAPTATSSVQELPLVTGPPGIVARICGYVECWRLAAYGFGPNAQAGMCGTHRMAGMVCLGSVPANHDDDVDFGGGPAEEPCASPSTYNDEVHMLKEDIKEKMTTWSRLMVEKLDTVLKDEPREQLVRMQARITGALKKVQEERQLGNAADMMDFWKHVDSGYKPSSSKSRTGPQRESQVHKARRTGGKLGRPRGRGRSSGGRGGQR